MTRIDHFAHVTTWGGENELLAAWHQLRADFRVARQDADPMPSIVLFPRLDSATRAIHDQGTRLLDARHQLGYKVRRARGGLTELKRRVRSAAQVLHRGYSDYD